MKKCHLPISFERGVPDTFLADKFCNELYLRCLWLPWKDYPHVYSPVHIQYCGDNLCAHLGMPVCVCIAHGGTRRGGRGVTGRDGAKKGHNNKSVQRLQVTQWSLDKKTEGGKFPLLWKQNNILKRLLGYSLTWVNCKLR